MSVMQIANNGKGSNPYIKNDIYKICKLNLQRFSMKATY